MAMPLFMDIHQQVEGLTEDAVAGAHARDLEVQKKYGVDYRQYWFDEASRKVFCLVEAPSKRPPSLCIAKRTAWSRTR
jgi:hypothetical protein